MQTGKIGFFTVATVIVVAVFAGLSCTPPGGVEGVPKTSIRLMIQTGDSATTEELAHDLKRHFDRNVVVDPLFPDIDPENDPLGMSRMFLAEVPGVLAPGDKPWNIANDAFDALGYERVEPDLEDTLEPATERLAGSCTVGDSTPAPTDQGWSLRNIRVDRAWKLEPPAGGARFGTGVRICHPDTGWTVHDDLDHDRLDLDLATNLLDSGPIDGRDPLNYSGLLKFPGHGTGTGSVIMSGGGLTDPSGTSLPGVVTGVAPGATLVAIRSARSVVRVFDSKLARAVHYATTADCDVISISLGGRFFFGLEAAIRDAVRRGKIVVAAAGNCVGIVVAPASYDECIAVAGSNVYDRPWRGSSRGRAVTISAPGEHVWRAHRESPDDSVRGVGPGEGTSFAVAGVAGVAALWLAHHGPDAIHERFSHGLTVQDAFVEVIQRTARPVPDLDPAKFGPGVVDAEAVLLFNLDLLDDGGAVARRAPTRAVDRFAAMLDRDSAELRPRIAELLRVRPDEVDTAFDRWGSELVYLALQDPDGFEAVLDEPLEGVGTTARSARVAGWADRHASRALRAAMESSG